MTQHAIVRKTARIAGMAAILGATAAVILVGGPADAATSETSRGVVIAMSRGV